MTELAYIGLGSNQGNRVSNVRAAVEMIGKLSGAKVKRVSSLYETVADGVGPQPDYMNAVAEVETSLDPAGLLDALEEIERRLGRDAKGLRRPRTMDLDILLFGDRIIAGERLTVPHARLHERAFALVPLAELAPDLVHPLLGKNVRRLLDENGGKGVKGKGRI